MHTYRFIFTVDDDPCTYHDDFLASNCKEAEKKWKAMIPFSRRRVHIIKVIPLS